MHTLMAFSITSIHHLFHFQLHWLSNCTEKKNNRGWVKESHRGKTTHSRVDVNNTHPDHTIAIWWCETFGYLYDSVMFIINIVYHTQLEVKFCTIAVHVDLLPCHCRGKYHILPPIFLRNRLTARTISRDVLGMDGILSNETREVYTSIVHPFLGGSVCCFKYLGWLMKVWFKRD